MHPAHLWSFRWSALTVGPESGVDREGWCKLVMMNEAATESEAVMCVRALAAHALSIFGDPQDVMACRIRNVPRGGQNRSIDERGSGKRD
jgi:hypothetical protein